MYKMTCKFLDAETAVVCCIVIYCILIFSSISNVSGETGNFIDCKSNYSDNTDETESTNIDNAVASMQFSPILNRFLVPTPKTYAHRVVSETAHDKTCFTQGLQTLSVKFSDNPSTVYNSDANDAILPLHPFVLGESCGLYNQSVVRLISSQNGQPLETYPVYQLPPYMFAEGLVAEGGSIYVLTWINRVLIELDRDTLKLISLHPYPYDGWGLTAGPKLIKPQNEKVRVLYATDGSDTIRVFENQMGFQGPVLLHTMRVSCNNNRIDKLNELEFIYPHFLFINVWLQDYIVIFNVAEERCMGMLDLSHIDDKQKNQFSNVLNGIAHYFVPKRINLLKNETPTKLGDDINDSGLGIVVTGKMWDKMYYIWVENLD